MSPMTWRRKGTPGPVPAELRFFIPQACIGLVLFLLVLIGPSMALAGGITVENQDRNKLIEILDVSSGESDAIVLYSTRPQRGQPHSSERCTTNFYLLRLSRGLRGVQPSLLAENQCARGAGNASLLANGDMLLLAGDQVETWRLGEGRVSQWSFGAVDVLQGRWNELNGDGAAVDVGTDGNLVFAKGYYRKRNDSQTPSGMVVGLDSEGKTRWRLELNEPGVLLGILEAWVTPDGGALLHLLARSMDDGTAIPGADAPEGSLVISQNRLYRLSASGEPTAPIVIASFQMMDFSNPVAAPDMATDPEGFQAFLEGSTDQTRTDAWAAGDVIARPGPNGAMDVLLGARSREARMLRVGKRGEVLLDADLTTVMEQEGLPPWVDFSIDNNDVMLFGSLGTRQNRLPQGYVSRIELPDGPAVTRLAPMSELGLEEARAAGDEELQYLENNPSQQPQRLTLLGDHPVTISLVWRSRRQVIQIDEIDEQSLVYTEARDERTARQAKEVQRAQRKADRESSQQAMSSEMAEAIGVSEEEYAAMSNQERKEAMVRNGDMEAVMAAAMKQAEAAMQQISAQQGANGAAMTPEMAAAMAQAQQAMAAAGMTMPGASAANPAGSSDATRGVVAEHALLLDSNLHGTLEFEHPDGLATTLFILDRQSGDELFRKDYEDGSVYEYLDFNRYQLPLNQIAVVLSDADERKLRELTPVTTE